MAKSRKLGGKLRVDDQNEAEAVQSPNVQEDADQATVDGVPEEVAEEETYEYSPLDRSLESTFRLLTLLPGPKGSQPRCTLSIGTWRDSKCPYEALSYVWGDSRTTKSILIDGKAFEVRENLFSALGHLRFDDRPRVLWVDAICIDQNRIKERNHQIASMGNIYKNCSNVVVWLGDEDDDTESVVKFIDSTFHEIEQKIPASPRYRNWSEILELYASIKERIPQGLLRPELQAGWASFQNHVLERTWWSRAWVVQEYANAPEATFHIGGFCIPWNLISALTIVLREAMSLKPGFHFHNWPIFDSALELTDNRLTKQAENSIKMSGGSDWKIPDAGSFFIRLLHSQSKKSCQDPKDKIFSILSMIDETISRSLSPDYLASTVSTYVATVKTYINVSKRLDILAFDKEESTQGFPSWCPNWNMKPFCDDITQDTDNAIYETSRETEALVAFSRNESTMYVKGFFVCTIINGCFQESTEDIAYVDEYDTVQSRWDINYMAQKFRHIGTFWDSSSNSDEEFEQGKQAFNVVTTTLVAGFWADHTPDPPVEKDVVTGEWWPAGNKDQFLIEAESRTRNRTVVLTDDGNLGIVSKKTKIGDEVWIFLGASTPFILRKSDEMNGTRQVRRFVGPAYVHGVMQGEAMDGLEKGRYELQTVALQ